MRVNIQQDDASDVAGRGINQKTGELVVARRLAKEDRNYQSIVNRALIANSPTIAQDYTLSDEGFASSDETIGDQLYDEDVQSGALINSDKTNNVWETIVVPTPQFVTVTYEVEVWTQYVEEMNQIAEGILSSFLPQTKGWRIDTPKGYWFIGKFEGTFENTGNFSEMSGAERVVKSKFTVTVPAYIFATSVPGAPVPVRRYISSPRVEFDIEATSSSDLASIQSDVVDDPNLGASDPTLPGEPDRPLRQDARRVGDGAVYPNRSSGVNPNDPALRSMPRGRDPSRYRRVQYIDPKGRKRWKYIRITSVNAAAGETVYTSDFTLD